MYEHIWKPLQVGQIKSVPSNVSFLPFTAKEYCRDHFVEIYEVAKQYSVEMLQPKIYTVSCILNNANL